MKSTEKIKTTKRNELQVSNELIAELFTFAAGAARDSDFSTMDAAVRLAHRLVVRRAP